MTCAAIIVAAGSGSRARRSTDTVSKQYVKLAGKSALSHTLKVFMASSSIDYVQVVIADGDQDLYQEAIKPLLHSEEATAQQPRLLPLVIGGSTRQLSVRNGLEALLDLNISTVLIHDAARIFVSEAILARCQKALQLHRACLVAVPVTDTIKRVDEQHRILDTIDRSTLWAAQTPQCFDYPFILDAHREATRQTLANFTDDAAIAEWAGETVHIVEGEATNIKLTNREDLDMAHQKLSQSDTTKAPLTDIRLGNGYDVHAFEPGDAVIIGGVSIPHDCKLKGHSDADVGLHAITDAILGALADGDIGTHFPPSDSQWKGAASDLFLKDAVQRVTERGGKIGNIDLTIICEAPKIGPHRPAMRQAIAEICGLSIDRISVKATTSERLGFTGRKEGIAALATACLRLPDTD